MILETSLRIVRYFIIKYDAINWHYAIKYFYIKHYLSLALPVSVSDAQSHGIKILARFPGNPILEILIEIRHCVGSTNMRGKFILKVCCFPYHD